MPRTEDTTQFNLTYMLLFMCTCVSSHADLSTAVHADV